MDREDRQLEIDQNVPSNTNMAFGLCTMGLLVVYLISEDLPLIIGTLGQS